MRTREIVPTAFIETPDHKPAYSGKVVMKVMGFNDRDILKNKIAAKLASRKAEVLEVAKAMESGTEDEQAQALGSEVGGAMIRLMVEHLPEQIVEIDITRLSDGEKLTTWDDLDYEPDLHGVIYELAGAIMGNPKQTRPEPSAKASRKPRSGRSTAPGEATT